LAVSKLAVRDHLRGIDQEDVWTEMQGYVYGARMDEAAMYPGAISWEPSAPKENDRVTDDRCRPASRERPKLSTATTWTWWPRLAAPSAKLCTTRSIPPERGQ